MSARVKIFEESRAKQGIYIYLIWCENQTHTRDIDTALNNNLTN